MEGKVLVTTKDGEDLAGKFSADSNLLRIAAKPGYGDMLRRMADTPNFVRGEVLDSKTDPLGWLKAASLVYRGSYVRVQIMPPLPIQKGS
jgi:hypothetical protein